MFFLSVLRLLQEFPGKKKTIRDSVTALPNRWHSWTFSLHLKFVKARPWGGLLIVTLSLHLEVIGQQFVLTVAEGEGEERQQERVQDADDGQDVSPAHRAVPQAVLVRPLAAHPLHLRRVPAVRVDHAAHHHQHGCEGWDQREQWAWQ